MSIKPPFNKTVLGIIAAIVAASFFALSLVSARISYDYGTNMQTIMLIRFGIMIGVLLVWNKITNTSINPPTNVKIKSSLLGVFYFVGIGAYLVSVAYLPAGLAVLIFYTFPILVIMLTALLEKKKPGLWQIIALLLAFTGLFIALDINLDGNTKDTQAIGVILAIIASLGVAVNMIGSANILKTVPFTQFGLYQVIMVTAIAGVMVMLTGGVALPQSGIENSTGWLAFMSMLISFVIAYISVYTALELVGAVSTSTIMNLEPVMTTVFAIALLGEIMTAQKLVGGLIVLSAILMVQWPLIKPLLAKKI